VKQPTIVPNGWPCKFRDCPAGLFQYGDATSFHLKTEYRVDGFFEAFVVASGEAFWGGATTYDERDNLIVVPAKIEVKE